MDGPTIRLVTIGNFLLTKKNSRFLPNYTHCLVTDIIIFIHGKPEPNLKNRIN